MNALDQNQLNFQHAQHTQNVANLLSRLQQQQGKLVDKRVEILQMEQSAELAKGAEPSTLEIEQELHQNQKYMDKIRTREAYLAQLREHQVNLKDKNAPLVKRMQAKIQSIDLEIEDLKHELVPEIRQSLYGDRSAGVAAALEAAKRAEAMIAQDVARSRG